MVNEREILNLKKQAGDMRDSVIEAKATMKEVVSNINRYTEELKEKGIKNIDNAEEEINSMKAKMEELYSEAKTKLEKALEKLV